MSESGWACAVAVFHLYWYSVFFFVLFQGYHCCYFFGHTIRKFWIALAVTEIEVYENQTQMPWKINISLLPNLLPQYKQNGVKNYKWLIIKYQNYGILIIKLVLAWGKVTVDARTQTRSTMWFEVAPQLFHTYVLTPVLDLHSECFSRFTAHLHHDNRHSDTSSHFLLHGNTEGLYCDLQLQYIQIHVHTLEMNCNITLY